MEGAAEPRHLLGWVQGCGTFILAGGDVELWSAPLERRSRWSRFCGSARDRYCLDHRLLAPTAECGAYAVRESGDGFFVRRVSVDGTEEWEVPITPAQAAPIPLADGGVLIFTSTELVRLDRSGGEVWRWPVPADVGSVVTWTPILSESGRAYFATDYEAGSYRVVAVDVGVAPGPMAWFESGSNPARTGVVR
jgi:hypothetical protein